MNMRGTAALLALLGLLAGATAQRLGSQDYCQVLVGPPRRARRRAARPASSDAAISGRGRHRAGIGCGQRPPLNHRWLSQPRSSRARALGPQDYSTLTEPYEGATFWTTIARAGQTPAYVGDRTPYLACNATLTQSCSDARRTLLNVSRCRRR